MIRLEREGGLWTVTLDRAEKANALTGEMLREVAEIAEAAGEARAFVLTGVGKVFSAGADLGAVKAGLATDPVWERASGAIAALPCLTVAALNGTLAGGAFGMVLACDLRVAVPGAKFFYPVMKLGYLPQPSDPARLAALVGPARAKHLLMGGQKIDAEAARGIGLVDEISETPVARAREIATDVIGAEASHVAAIKGMFG